MMGNEKGNGETRHNLVRWLTIGVALLVLAANFYLEVQEQFRHEEAVLNDRLLRLETAVEEIRKENQMLRSWAFGRDDLQSDQ